MRIQLALLRALAAIGLLSSSLSAAEKLSLNSLFTDHAVLQRDAAVPIWGKAEPGSEVTVEFAGQKKSATAGADGKWIARLDPLPPVGGRVRIKERAVQTNESQVVRPAENFVREQLLHEQIPLHPVRWRAEHRNQLRVTTGSRQHFLRFSQVHRHPGLTENVFARFERGDRDCGMHGGRGADPDHIELGHA